MPKRRGVVIDLEQAEEQVESQCKRGRNVGESTSNPPPVDQNREEDVFGLKPPPPEARPTYSQWCEYFLSLEFPRASMAMVKRGLICHCGRLGPAYQALHREYQMAVAREQGREGPIEDPPNWLPPEGFRLNKHHRRVLYPSYEACPVFDRELAVLRKRYFDTQPGVEPDNKGATAEIECGCCFSESPFEQLVQCADGHLFCFSCLKRHVEEAAFGGGQPHTGLPCMDTNGCPEYFPWSEVQRALPENVLSKYERRLAEDCIARARLEGLVYCPFCNFPCEVDPGLHVLECPNTSCRKSSCLKCKEPNHLPLECHEVENKSETALRRRVEEVMTKALIRECLKCKAELVKIDGCNKITCRCGQSMCYLCRKSIRADYSHFCRHPREPGQGCRMCALCSLWEEEKSDDVVKAAKEAALHEVAQLEPGIVNRRIGPDQNDRPVIVSL